MFKLILAAVAVGIVSAISGRCGGNTDAAENVDCSGGDGCITKQVDGTTVYNRKPGEVGVDRKNPDEGGSGITDVNVCRNPQVCVSRGNDADGLGDQTHCPVFGPEPDCSTYKATCYSVTDPDVHLDSSNFMCCTPTPEWTIGSDPKAGTVLTPKAGKCSQTDGTAKNGATCNCGTSICNGVARVEQTEDGPDKTIEAELYCNLANSRCSKIPNCLNTAGLIANEVECQCGISAKCGDTNKYCIKATNTCDSGLVKSMSEVATLSSKVSDLQNALKKCVLPTGTPTDIELAKMCGDGTTFDKAKKKCATDPTSRCTTNSVSAEESAGSAHFVSRTSTLTATVIIVLLYKL